MKFFSLSLLRIGLSVAFCLGACGGGVLAEEKAALKFNLKTAMEERSATRGGQRDGKFYAPDHTSLAR